MSEEDVIRDVEDRWKVLLAGLRLLFPEEPEALDYVDSQWGDKIGERRSVAHAMHCIFTYQFEVTMFTTITRVFFAL